MYSYKKEFFKNWFEKKNKTLTKAKLGNVLGTSPMNSLQYWLLEKELPPLKDPSKDTGDRDWLPVRCILLLCNYFPDLKLSDFIENAEDVVIKRKANTQEKGDKATRLELLEEKLAHQQDMNALQQKMLEREKELQDSYERRMTELRQTMQRTIDAQLQTINMLKHRAITDDRRDAVSPL